MTDKINIVCSWRPSEDFPLETVLNLFKGCRIAMGDREFDFHCLTTHPEEIPFPILAHESEHPEWVGFWSKIELFKPNLFTGTVIYFDLDTIVQEIPSIPFCGDRFWMIRDLNRRRRIASGVMAWSNDYCAPIYHDFLRWHDEKHLPVMRRSRKNRDKRGREAFPDKGDQQYISRRIEELGLKVSRLQNIWNVCSFKKHIRSGIVKGHGEHVICFHGNPRPQNANHPLVIQHLKRMQETPI